MKAKALIPLVLALALGGLTFAIGRRVLNKQATAAPTTQAGARVLVASAALPAGHELTAGDVRFAETPVEAVTATMFRDPKALEGRVLAAPLESGQIVRQSVLAPDGTSSALQARVPPGMRAVTISVNEFSGLAGLIAPGAKVDLVATLVDNVSGETFAKTIVQNVMVSAVGQELEPGVMPKPDQRTTARAHKTVTLLVTPTQAAAIDLAFAKSKPRLVLRSSDDDAPVLDKGVSLAELSGRAQEQDRLAVTAKDDGQSATDELKRMLSAMQKQIEDVRQSNQTPAPVTEPSLPAKPPTHAVRVFRGASETQQLFIEQGGATTRPTRQSERVEGPQADEDARASAQK